MQLPILLFLFLLSVTGVGNAAVEVRSAEDGRGWTFSNNSISAVLRLTEQDTLLLEHISASASGDRWATPASLPRSPIALTFDTTAFGAATRYRVLDHTLEDVQPGGRRLTLTLRDLQERFEFRLRIEIYEGHPVLRQSVTVRNLQPRTVTVRNAEMLPYRFDAGESKYTTFRVTQWTILPRETNFDVAQTALVPGGAAIPIRSGARGVHCSWVALRDESSRGLFAGWEFNGRADATVRHVAEPSYIQLTAPILDLYSPLEPDGEFTVPWSFLGLFHGDWDEAANLTQRFVDAVLAKHFTDAANFPYVTWDSWAFGNSLDERALRRNAEIAARLGIELFVVDLGWARSIGDWHEDPAKFPGGLRALSDYVHSLGMKFGLHYAFSEAAPDSPVLSENPDWTSSETYYYHGALSLCLAHKPVREWVVQEAIRIIDEYGVDWILQDGENMVKHCTKDSHTHDPRDSNYAGSVEGIDRILADIQQARPNVYWENCEDGGNMMTFRMVGQYVTSITNDASGALESRQAVYGATYPFPPRYANRYMIEQNLDSYVTRSYAFGGPWVFMIRLDEMDAEGLEFAAAEIAMYKRMRPVIQGGKVYHLTAAPAERRIDAIQSYNQQMDRAVAVVTRDGAAAARYVLRPKGLRPEGEYVVTFRDDTRVLLMTGEQLGRAGVAVNLPQPHSAEVVFIEPN